MRDQTPPSIASRSAAAVPRRRKTLTSLTARWAVFQRNDQPMIAYTATQTTESDVTDGGERSLLGRTPAIAIHSAATEIRSAPPSAASGLTLPRRAKRWPPSLRWGEPSAWQPNPPGNCSATVCRSFATAISKGLLLERHPTKT
jgi:hypothetical protein